MLVLSRNIDQVIRIGRDIIVTIVAIKGGTVKLGINAPKNIEVHRQEVFDRIQQNNRDTFSDAS